MLGARQAGTAQLSAAAAQPRERLQGQDRALKKHRQLPVAKKSSPRSRVLAPAQQASAFSMH